jgi:hypothetical protein
MPAWSEPIATQRQVLRKLNACRREKCRRRVWKTLLERTKSWTQSGFLWAKMDTYTLATMRAIVSRVNANRKGLQNISGVGRIACLAQVV